MTRLLALVCCIFLLIQPSFSQDGDKALAYFNDGTYDSALFFVDKALANDPDELAALLKLKGDILSYQNEVQKSIEFYKKGLLAIQSSEIKDLTLLTESYGGLAFSYGYLGLYNKAIEYQHIGLSYAQKLENPTEIASGYFNLATYSTQLARYDSAIFFISKAYEIDFAANDSSAISSDLNTLGYLYGQMGDYTKAIDYHLQSIDFLKPHEKDKLASRYNNLGMMEMELGKFNEAEAYLIQSLELHRELNDSLKMAQRRQNLATLYSKINLKTKALAYIRDAISYYQRTKNKYYEASGRIHLARMLANQGEVDFAIREIDKAIPLAEEAKNLNILAEAHQLLVSFYEKIDNPPLAFDALKKQKFYEDSLKSNQKISELNDLELRLVTEQKEKEIELLEIRKQLSKANIQKKQRTILFLAIGLSILIMAAIWIIVTQKQKFKLKEDLLSKETDNLRLQINALLGTGDQSIQVAMDDVNDKLKERLSEREFEILKLAITEKSNKEIANAIFVSVNTVKFHLKNIYEKLGVSNRKEALQFVIKD